MMSSSDRADPRHFDGGASLLLGAITIYGRRRVLLMCSGTPDITLTQDSGDFYLAAMCAIEHQVLHEAAVPGELIQLDAVGQVKVSVLLRGPPSGGPGVPSGPTQQLLSRQRRELSASGSAKQACTPQVWSSAWRFTTRTVLKIACIWDCCSHFGCIWDLACCV